MSQKKCCPDLLDVPLSGVLSSKGGLKGKHENQNPLLGGLSKCVLEGFKETPTNPFAAAQALL